MNARPKGRRASSPSRLRQLAPWITVAALVLAVGAVVLWLSPPAQSPEEADIVVYKRPTCGCCSKWLEHLRRHDLSVAVVNVRSTQPMQSRVGVPPRTGFVPHGDRRRLLGRRPCAGGPHQTVDE